MISFTLGTVGACEPAPYGGQFLPDLKGRQPSLDREFGFQPTQQFALVRSGRSAHLHQKFHQRWAVIGQIGRAFVADRA